MLRATEVLQKLDRGSIGPVYVLFGPETRLRDALVSAISRRLVEPGWEEMNVVRFSGDHPEVYQLARTRTFGGGMRVILCSDSQVLGGGRKEAAAAQAQDMLLRYMERPGSDSCLVLACPVDKADQRLRVVRRLQEAAALVECGTPSVTEAMEWATKYAAAGGKKLSREAAAYIVEGCLRRLGDIERELDKLVLYVGDQKQISLQAARDAAAARGAVIFDLTDALTAGHREKAFSALQLLLRQGEAPVMIVFMLARQFRLLWHAARLFSQGKRSYAVAQALRLPQFVTDKLLAGVSGLNRAELASAFRILLEADIAIKSGQMDEKHAVELAVLKLCRLRVERE
ncbi:MAG: DNA polymerase III subunit delta [Bacillota bacterium]